MEKKFDQKFVFTWKDGSLDFSYEQDGNYSKGQIKKSFDFGEGNKEIVADSEWARDAVKPNLLTEQPSVHLEPIIDPGVPPERKAYFVDTGSMPPDLAQQYIDDALASMEPVVEPEDAIIDVEVEDVLPEPELPPESVAEPVTPISVVDVLVNANDATVPTVQVRMPETLPQIVAVDASTIGSDVDVSSPHAQMVVEMTDATIKVPDDAKLHVVKTANGTSDLIVAVPPALETFENVDIVDTVRKAVGIWETAPELPDLSVTDPDEVVNVMPQLVQMHFDGSEVVLRNVCEDVPEDHHLLPVDTPADMPNIVAVIDDETKAMFENLGLDPAKELAKFLASANTEIATCVPVHEKDVFDAFGHECEGDTCEKKRWHRTK